jgi:predicted RNase H-like HicB family nuclease
MSELVWEDPPGDPRGPGGAAFPGVREQLQQNPGRWARLTVKPTWRAAGSMAYTINSRKAYSSLHGCEAVSRTVDGEHVVYVRWPADQPEIPYTFHIVLTHDYLDGGYIASCETLPGCSSQGETKKEALANLAETIEHVLEMRAEFEEFLDTCVLHDGIPCGAPAGIGCPICGVPAPANETEVESNE